MFDDVIVGGGTAGAILAARLSERPESRVLLIEAGRDFADRPSMPADLLDSRNLAGPTHDWRYTASPTAGRTIPYQRGKVTGGTSAINAAAALWARPADFARWAALGNGDWSWANVAPWFQSLESDRGGGGPHHGLRGPVPIARYVRDDFIAIQRAFYDACREADFPPVGDHNGTSVLGVGPWPMNRDGDTRVSTALSHLSAARGRGNLVVRAETMADRIVFEGNRAVGVQLIDGSVERGRRFILAAGAIASPAILMRSGIGPRQDLERLGIEMRRDLPGVGRRLWDHAAVPIRLVPLMGECVIGRDPRFQVVARYTAEASDEPEDMQLVMTSHLDLGAAPALREEAGTATVAVLRVALMVPRGHGSLTLASRDPAVQPRIDLNFCADVEDVRRLMQGTRLAWKILKLPAMKGSYQRVAGLTDAVVASDDRLLEYMRANVGTYCHALGTAPMGSGDDPFAVVDQRCKVYGTENLFVVDASVFPAVPRVVPNLTIMMIAERLAAMLRAG